MPLDNEINDAKRQVSTDAYQMSIGEIVSMYESDELIIDPEFQRLFRWNTSQKSKLIESLLLGIPIPSIFVFERDDGRWELIDGLQRVSTILEFMGKLRSSENGEALAPSILDATTYLPSLHNAVWERSEAIPNIEAQYQNEIGKASELAIRRSRLGVQILKRPSDNKTKYDLFQRLNAGGTVANAQELRNCVMIMVNPGFFREIKAAAENAAFLNVVGISDEGIERQRHLEMAVRFLVHTKVDYDGALDVEEYIDNGIQQLAEHQNGQELATLIVDTFSLLDQAAGNNILRRYDGRGYVGKIGLVGLEGIAVGVASNLAMIRDLQDRAAFVLQKSQQFWSQRQTENITSPGMRGTTRIQRTVPFGKLWFAR